MGAQGRLGSDLTEGSVSRGLIRFAIPFMLSNGLQAVYSMVDMLVVGRVVGSAGLSAVSISSMLVMLMTTLCMGFSTGGQVVIAQLIGLGARDRLNRTIGTLFTAVIGFAVLMTAVGLTLSRPLLHLLNTPEESLAEAADYMRICSGCIVFTYGYNMVSAVLRGMGDSKNPLLFIAIASAVNVALDLLCWDGGSPARPGRRSSARRSVSPFPSFTFTAGAKRSASISSRRALRSTAPYSKRWLSSGCRSPSR